MIFGYFKIANISYCIIFDVLLFICKIYITSMVCLSSTCTVFGVIYTHTHQNLKTFKAISKFLPNSKTNFISTLSILSGKEEIF